MGICNGGTSDLACWRRTVYTSRTMVITYHGGQCFKLTRGDTTIAFDPPAKSADWPAVKFGADVVFGSMHHPNFAGYEQMTMGTRTPFVIHGPGEYEVGEVTARGFGVETEYQGETRYNTIYQLQFDSMNIVFLGALGNPEIDGKILGALTDIDILFVPIGGGDVLEVPQASKLAVKLEARAVIPMHYDKTALQAFLHEEGADGTKPQEKCTLKAKDVAAMEGEVIVLQS